AVTRRIEILREKINVPPTTPQNQAEVAIAGEIRAMCRAAENPEAFAFAHRSNAQTVAAILSAPDFLSGLSAEAAERIRVVALEALHPNEVRQIADLEAAQKVALDAVDLARERIAKRGDVKLNSK